MDGGEGTSRLGGVRGNLMGGRCLKGLGGKEGAVEGWEKQDGPPSARKLLTETFNGCLDLGNHRGFLGASCSPSSSGKPRGNQKPGQRNSLLAPRTQILGTDVSSGFCLYLPFSSLSHLGAEAGSRSCLCLFPVPLDL